MQLDRPDRKAAKMSKLCSDFSLIEDPAAPSHPAFAHFVRAMDGRAYGAGPLNSAWLFFRAGWDAADATPLASPSPKTGIAAGPTYDHFCERCGQMVEVDDGCCAVCCGDVITGADSDATPAPSQ